MTKEVELWGFAADKLKQNESVMLLVVAESEGSSPGRQGFKMIVAADELAGSIGGGVMEVCLVKQAKLQITDYKLQSNSKIVEQVHQKNAADSSGMICSGKQTVIFYTLKPSDLKTVNEIIDVLENDYYLSLQITEKDLKVADLLARNKSADTTQCKSAGGFEIRFEKFDENKFLYEELLGFKNILFIIGGGHCALALSELMVKLDFRILLFDDRADLNTLAKNKYVHFKHIIESYDKIGDFIEGGTNVYVVVMTLGYKFDEIVIRKLFDKNFKYFGVLGSKAKMKILLKSLENEGFDKEILAQIHTPIGLPINSRTPEEIAVSIAAEIIAVKNSVAIGD